MKWIEADNKFELASRKRFYANNGILGIEPDGSFVSHGADGGVGAPDDFTSEERDEIASHAIAAWQVWREGVK